MGIQQETAIGVSQYVTKETSPFTFLVSWKVDQSIAAYFSVLHAYLYVKLHLLFDICNGRKNTTCRCICPNISDRCIPGGQSKCNQVV
jgi:hypothetical protein